MAECLIHVTDFITILNHSIISLLCPVWVRALSDVHVGQAKVCLHVCLAVFIGVYMLLQFLPNQLIGQLLTCVQKKR